MDRGVCRDYYRVRPFRLLIGSERQSKGRTINPLSRTYLALFTCIRTSRLYWGSWVSKSHLAKAFKNQEDCYFGSPIVRQQLRYLRNSRVLEPS